MYSITRNIAFIFGLVVLLSSCSSNPKPTQSQKGSAQDSKEWNKDSVVDLCGGMSSVSPFIGDRGEILSIKVNEEEKTATFSVLSGKMIVTSTCYLKPDGRTSIKTDSILPK
tara:strand:+ start:45 stop:380 length:336 start_codon:yes stop_codon:yes gene_type:complete